MTFSCASSVSRVETSFSMILKLASLDRTISELARLLAVTSMTSLADLPLILR